METRKIPAREDVAAQDKWAIEDLFATDDAWREALAAAKEFIPRVTAFRGHLAESGETLLRFFRLDDEISLAFDPIVHYATAPQRCRILAWRRIRKWSRR